MRRIWLDPENIQGQEFELTGEAYHHAVQVTRFKEGDLFEIICGQPKALVVEVQKVLKKSALLKVTRRRELAGLKQPYIHLAIGLCRWNVFEEIIEKSVELGVHTLQPLITDYSFIKNKKDISGQRQQRWLKINQSASAQSGRAELMKIQAPSDLSTLLKTINQNPKTACLFAFEGTGDSAVSDELQRIVAQTPDEIWAIVGSEGGFSASEVELLKSQQIPPVTMGSQVLRVETACFALISVIKYQADLMR